MNDETRTAPVSSGRRRMDNLVAGKKEKDFRPGQPSRKKRYINGIVKIPFTKPGRCRYLWLMSRTLCQVRE